ncbi:10396_t:CDS:1 [Funneliformis geosporum]|uniref:8100_t:CDS:1 n=1 Tax=Funneliformis geosporum TaxID=1117311 RepID=A0A9W4WV49_9GLOM|nr:8100_t:CDS:1 [Funneliformis geosporum]CAI2192382.1 10396_t:CDS:1 [Funneliformis geosporum]
MTFSRLSSTLNATFNRGGLLLSRSFRQDIVRPIIINRALSSSKTSLNAIPTAYESDKDYYALKVTIDDIRAKYGLRGGNRIKDANLEQNSDLDLEVDLTLADVKKLAKIQQLLSKASTDLSSLISSSSENFEGINDDDIVIKANVKRSVWLAEDDDVSGYAENAIKAFKENKVIGNANAYDLDDGKTESNPAGFRQDLYS